MALPVPPPVKPMLAAAVDAIPAGMRYEPKWDGFRTLVFKDGDHIELTSRNTRPLTRYFPELIEALGAALPQRCVLDGETVVPRDGVLDFEALLARVHPAASRVRQLAAATPAEFVAFDLLAETDRSLLTAPFVDRSAALRALLRPHPQVHATPYTDDQQVARQWFSAFEGAGLDGIVAKPFQLAYLPDKRAMFKIKHQRTADCVVGGYRVHASGSGVGSLLLGLYDDAGVLQHVGVAGAFPMARRREMARELEPLRTAPGEGHPWLGQAGTGDRVPGGAPSRWNAHKDMSFVPLAPALVVEVAYDHMEGSRFRHTTQLVRFRPDREPASCGYGQLERPVGFALDRVLAGEGP